MELITLDNSLRIILNHIPSMRSATVGIWVGAGSRYEKESENGISHFIEHIVFKGSKTRSGFAIAEGMDEIGAHVNAYTTKEYTYFYTKALDYQILKASDILFDMLKNPLLKESDIETEKGVVIEEIAMCEDDPGDVCYELTEKSIFSPSSLSMEILGSRKTVSSFKNTDIKAYMSKFYVPERIVIGVSGNFEREEIVKKIKEYFGALKDTGNPVEEYEVPFKKCVALKKTDTEQTHISLTFKGIPVDHEELYDLQVCMFILGTGTSSMLNQRIREELGLVYSIDAWLGRYMGGGYICVNMSLGAQSEEKAIIESIDIIKKFSSAVTQKKVTVAKEKLISSLIMSREQPQSKLSAMGYSQLLLNRFVEDDEIIERIKKVDLNAVKNMAEKYFDLNKLSFTAVGRVKSEEEYNKILTKAINGEKRGKVKNGNQDE